MQVNLYNDDCLKVMQSIPDNSVDCVVTDCPYHIVSGGCTNVKNKPGTTFYQSNAKSGKLFDNNDIEFEKWLPDVYRVLKDNSHCYIMINGRNLKDLQTQAEKVGFVFQQLLVWNKGNATPNRYYLNACEFILMLRKGGAKNINNMGTKNILSIPNIKGGKSHPTEKPVDLMSIMIENSTNLGEVVLDPFMGSGATGVACVNTNRKFIGIELDENYFNVAQERINKANSSWLDNLLGGIE